MAAEAQLMKCFVGVTDNKWFSFLSQRLDDARRQWLRVASKSALLPICSATGLFYTTTDPQAFDSTFCNQNA